MEKNCKNFVRFKKKGLKFEAKIYLRLKFFFHFCNIRYILRLLKFKNGKY